MRKNLYLTAIVFFFIDILTKLLVLSQGDVLFIKEIIPGHFNINLTYNSGAAFSLLQGERIILILIGLALLIIIDRIFIKDKITKLEFISLGMLIGGTLGNLLDRILDGYITDFFDIVIFNYHFPIFNVADIFITFGAFLLIVAVIKGEKHGNSSRTK